jgi:hypothetical protein
MTRSAKSATARTERMTMGPGSVSSTSAPAGRSRHSSPFDADLCCWEAAAPCLNAGRRLPDDAGADRQRADDLSPVGQGRHPLEARVHVIAETHRRAGHADIVRESIDGSAGFRPTNSNLPESEPDWWQSYRERLDGPLVTSAGWPTEGAV